MSQKENYKFVCLGYCRGRKDLTKIATTYRLAKKICRNCYNRLPLNARVCRACKNPDLRIKKSPWGSIGFHFDKNTKNRLYDKRNSS